MEPAVVSSATSWTLWSMELKSDWSILRVSSTPPLRVRMCEFVVPSLMTGTSSSPSLRAPLTSFETDKLSAPCASISLFTSSPLIDGSMPRPPSLSQTTTLAGSIFLPLIEGFSSQPEDVLSDSPSPLPWVTLFITASSSPPTKAVLSGSSPSTWIFLSITGSSPPATCTCTGMPLASSGSSLLPWIFSLLITGSSPPGKDAPSVSTGSPMSLWQVFCSGSSPYSPSVTLATGLAWVSLIKGTSPLAKAALTMSTSIAWSLPSLLVVISLLITGISSLSSTRVSREVSKI